MTFILAGATGLVGGHLATMLPPEQLTVVGRRALPTAGPNQLTGPVEQWPDLIGRSRYLVALCALGTTARQAGSREAFVAIDRDAVGQFAATAHKAGAEQFLLVSSVGAGARSSNFYLRTKGEAEALVSAIGFRRVDIMRPGLLRGQRSGPHRIGETLAIALSPLTDLLTPAVLDQYRSIAANRVAAAMAALIGAKEAGMFVHHNRDMEQLVGTDLS